MFWDVRACSTALELLGAVAAVIFALGAVLTGVGVWFSPADGLVFTPSDGLVFTPSDGAKKLVRNLQCLLCTWSLIPLFATSFLALKPSHFESTLQARQSVPGLNS